MKTNVSLVQRLLIPSLALAFAGLLPFASQSARAGTTTWASPPLVTSSSVSSTAGIVDITVPTGTWAVGDVIRFNGTTAATNPFGTSATRYYVVSVAGTTLQVSTTPGGTAINATNTTTVSTMQQGQDWLTGGNWTGGTAPNDSSTTASVSSMADTNVPVVVNGATTIYGLTYSGNVANDLTLVSGANGTSLNALTFATNDSTTPKLTLSVGSVSLIAIGTSSGGNMKLAIAGNQGLIFNSSAGGAITGSGLAATSTAPSKAIRIANADWTSFSGGLQIERGLVQLQASGQLPSQTLTVGNAQTITNNLLAGLNLSTNGGTVDALNGNSLGRIYGASTLNVGNANGTGDFGGVIGKDFAGGTTATNLTKSGSSTQTISGIMAGTGNIIVSGAGGTLIFSSSNSYTGNTTVTVGTLRATNVNALGATTGVSIGGAGILDLRSDSSATFTGAGGSAVAVNPSASGATINVDQATVAGTGQTITVGTLTVGSNASTAQTIFTGTNNTSLSIGAATNATAVSGTTRLTNNIGGGGSLTLASFADTRTGTPTLKFDGSGNTIVTGAITQAGVTAVSYTGSGKLTLSGSNSYTGGTTLSSGTLGIGDANALGTGALAISGGAVLTTAVRERSPSRTM